VLHGLTDELGQADVTTQGFGAPSGSGNFRDRQVHSHYVSAIKIRCDLLHRRVDTDFIWGFDFRAIALSPVQW
jgi:hypothetical protein